MFLSHDEAEFDDILSVLKRINSSLERIDGKLDQLITLQKS